MNISPEQLEALRAEHAAHAQRLENMEARRRGWLPAPSPHPARVTAPPATAPESMGLDQLGARVCSPGWQDEHTEGTSHLSHPVDRTEALDQVGARIYRN